MARAAAVPARQLRALGELTATGALDRFYLAGGTAVAFHLRHRVSRDLDLFGPPDASFAPFQRLARRAPDRVQVVRAGEVTLQLNVLAVPVDVVRYPYPPLERPVAGPGGARVAGLLDLATNKLAAIAKRGLARDFWDLHAIANAGISLRDACDAYVRRFGVAESDVYHLVTALTWFDDAEAERPFPSGLTARRWRSVRRWFEREAPLVLIDGTPR